MRSRALRSCLGLVVLSAVAVAAAAESDRPPDRLVVKSPSPGASVDTREPMFEVCLPPGREPAPDMKLDATLDGAPVGDLFRWHAACAIWRPGERLSDIPRLARARRGRIRPDDWIPALEDGPHVFRANLRGDPESATAQSDFVVRASRGEIGVALGRARTTAHGDATGLAPVATLDVRLARNAGWASAGDPHLLRFRSEGIVFGVLRPSTLGATTDAGEREITIWRLGLDDRRGYAWPLARGGYVAPYHAITAALARATVDGPAPPVVGPGGVDLAAIDGALRPQIGTEAGVAFGFGSFELTAGYEQEVLVTHVLPARLIGSGIVHGLALGFVRAVARETALHAPRTAPVVAFLLENAVSYAMVRQRHRAANWPFGGPVPLAHDAWRVTASWRF